ncbi:hypothetical protein [Bergeyella zoohelcum]|uniref:Uncharacterized protein n=1 Tax=Bergeyella zoohelcum ATCC 43767 TaxID=883096 RepID=K1M519_9FLAO|nr:hypothetical protein [Bergeyella zoohelcum]EKB57528.1 hypothetical protein HMPREF9699_01014 [Bergeyella zoohelcum ATCC 43767]SUV48802.1 Uncharacterised protein [Bergeyella zoohelcum]
MKIEDRYRELKTADNLMSNHLHNKLSTVLRDIISLVKDTEHEKILKDFYKETEDIPFAKKGSEEFLEISKLSYKVLQYIEENLL